MAVLKLQEAENREPTSVLIPVIQINMAWTYVALDETDQAIERFQKLVSGSPDLVEPYYGLGRCYLEKKDEKQAVKAFRNVIRLAPDSEMAAKARESLKNLGVPVEETSRTPVIIEKKAK
jgi:tetratricopeptide (TPR) repeat protein